MASSFSVWWDAARPKTLPASVSPVLLGGAFAWAFGAFDWRAFAMCFGFALFAQIAANFANDCFDGVRGTDTKDRQGPVRAVASGAVSPMQMRLATFGMLTLAALSGIGLVYFGGWWLVGVGALCLLGVLVYSWASYRGWGDLLVIFFFGFVAVGGTFYVQAGPPVPAVLLGALGLGLLCDNILLVNNYRDRKTDARTGKRTLVVERGERFAWAQYRWSVYFGAGLIPLALSWELKSLWMLLPWVLLPLGLRLARRLRTTEDNNHLNLLLADTARFLFLWTIAMALALIFAR